MLQAQPQLSREGMRQATAWWLQQPLHLQAIGYSERVARADIARFEAAVRADGPADYRVFDRGDAPGAGSGDDEVVAIRYIEPQQRNAARAGRQCAVHRCRGRRPSGARSAAASPAPAPASG